MSDHTEPTPETHIIRVHTGEGVVYARYMEPFFLPIPGSERLLNVCGQAPVPAGLTQQEVVDHFRAEGWEVEQDHGTDFYSPEWGE
jgi:hypothetical protein